MTLERALQKAANDASALLDAWKLNPHPRIAAVIGQLPASTAFTSLFEGKLAEVDDKLARLKDQRDAQLSNELERVLREPPWTSNTSRAVWSRVFSLVTASKDPRFIALAAELPGKWAMRSDQKDWMTRAFREATRSLPALVELTPEQSSLLTVIEREAFSAKPPTKRSAKVDFNAVYAAPHDDAPRLVLADALLEQEDPRGEFLSLQMRTEKTRAELKREKDLIKAHGKAWLAPFGPTLGASVTWRRGFPAEGLVKFRDAAEAAKYGSLPEWATFEALTWSPPRSPEHQAAAGFIGPAFRHLLRAEDVHLPHLLQGDWALKQVRGSIVSPAGLSAVLATQGLSKLASLHLTDAFFKADWLEAVRWGALEELGVATTYPPLLLHVLAVVEASPLARLQWGEALRFHRAPDGSLTRLELLDHLGSYRVDTQLESLPEGAVSELVQAPSAHWTTGPLGNALARATRKSTRAPSLARSAARHLLLNGVRSMAWAEGKVKVSDGAVTRTVDPKTLEVVASSDRGGLLSPDGREVLSLSSTGVVCFDFATSSERTVLEGKSLEGLCRSADGARAAVVKGSKVTVFELATGETIFECRGQNPALNATGTRLAVRASAIEVHELATRTKEALPGGLWTTVFLPDERLAQRESQKAVRVWSLGGKVLELPATPEHAWAIAADDRRVAVIQPGSTQVFDGRTGQSLGILEGAWGGLFAPDGTLFVAANDRLSAIVPKR